MQVAQIAAAGPIPVLVGFDTNDDAGIIYWAKGSRWYKRWILHANRGRSPPVLTDRRSHALSDVYAMAAAPIPRCLFSDFRKGRSRRLEEIIRGRVFRK